MPKPSRYQVTVLLDEPAEERFSAYCAQRGFKKSTLIVRLIREHLDREGFASQPSLLDRPTRAGARRSSSTGQLRATDENA
jgi:hypothetical protein